MKPCASPEQALTPASVRGYASDRPIARSRKKIMKVMAANGSPPPLFESDDERTAFVIRLPVHPLASATAPAVTGEVTGEIEKLLLVLDGEMARQGIQLALGLKHEDHFRSAYLVPALTAKLIETTLPDKPRSGKQRYRLTPLGRQTRREIESGK